MRQSYQPSTPVEWKAYLAGMAIGNEAATFALIGLHAPIRVKIDPAMSDDEGYLCISPEHRLLAHISPYQIDWVMEDSK